MGRGGRVALPTAPPSSAHFISEKTKAQKEEVTGPGSQSQSVPEPQAASFPALGAFSHPLLPPICENSVGSDLPCNQCPHSSPSLHGVAHSCQAQVTGLGKGCGDRPRGASSQQGEGRGRSCRDVEEGEGARGRGGRGRALPFQKPSH